MYGFVKMFQYGGYWLGNVRRWVQFKKYNGSTVKWGSDDVLNPPMTIRQVEEIAKIAAVAAGNEIMDKHIGLIKSRMKVLFDKVIDDSYSGGNAQPYQFAMEEMEKLIKLFEESAK